jgi:hypothetical protein
LANTTKKASIKVSGKESRATSLYAIDLGNGFTKRIFDGENVITEPSVFAEVPRLNNSKLKYFNIDNNFNYFVGQDVFNANLKPDVAVNSRERYFTPEYKQMLLGFIARDFSKYDVLDIPVLALGVPNTDHKAIGEKMEDFYTGKFVVTVNQSHQLLIDIKTCIVLPQPLGTYAYALTQNIIKQWGDNVLVCDAGTGSFDVASITGDIIQRDEGLTIGAKDAYMEIRKYLIDIHGDISTITVENMPNILANGLRKDGIPTIINEDPEVVKILDDNFNEMYKFLEHHKFEFDAHTCVLWTGGTSLLHKERIDKKRRGIFHVVPDAQEANVRGFYAIADSIEEDLDVE